MRSPMKFAFVAAFVWVASSAFAQGTIQTVVPFGFENQNGNSNDGIFEVGTQIQQLYRGSSLAQRWETPVQITGVAFRVADGTPRS